MNNEKEQKIQLAKEQLAQENIEQFPSVFQMARNLAKQAWLSGKGAALGEGFLASAEKAFERLKICSTCDFYRNSRCLKCGCFMERKAHLQVAHCPMNKWGEGPPPPEKNYVSPIPPIDLSTYPEEERNDIIKLAKEAVKTDGAFHYKTVRYVSKYQDDKLVIGLWFDRTTKPGFTPEEKTKFDELIKKAKVSDEKKFIFKGYEYTVVVDENNKANIKGRPLSFNMDT
jgi:hypothetical protein